MSQTAVTRTLTVDDVLTAATSMTAVVTRTDTSAVIANTPTNTSTGIYTFTITDPVGEYGLTYEFVITTVYAGETYVNTVTAYGPPAAVTTSMSSFDELYADVGLEVYSDNAPTGDNLTNVKRLVNQGYRELTADADWICLHPEATLDLTTGGDGNFDLPAGYAYMESSPIFNASNSALANIRESSASHILEARAGSTSGTYASLWAVRAKPFVAGTGQRWELMLWPTPGTALTVTIQYRLNPSLLAADGDYPVGGNAFNLAVRAYALRAAERDKRIADGPRAAEAAQALRSAIIEDARERAGGPIPIISQCKTYLPYDRRLTTLGPTVDGV